MSMQKVKKGDTVAMRSGSFKGKTGKVLAVLPRDGTVVVEGLNLVTKHRKPRRQGDKGQKITYPRAVPLSTVMVRCPSCQKSTRAGFRILPENKKERICKKCTATIS